MQNVRVKTGENRPDVTGKPVDIVPFETGASSQTAPGLRGVYLLLEPVNTEQREAGVVAIGLIDQLDSWVLARHQKNITSFVGILLSLGFALQLVARKMSL